MKDYKISFIVPVYNAEKFLKRCVYSLINQTYQNLEILLVDDGSEDGSGKLCDELAETDERIKVIHKENGGLVSAWKSGVRESSGMYLCFVDSDDWIDLTMIEEMSEYLTGGEEEIIASDYVIEKEDGSKNYVWQQLQPGEYDRSAVSKMVIPNLLGHESRYVTISRGMKLISRKLIEDNMKYSNPEIVMGEDTTIMLPSLIDCHRLVIMDHKAYYHYLYVNESMSHKYNSKLYDNIQLLKKTVFEIVKDKFTGKELEERLKQVEQEYIFWLMLVLKNEARGNPEGYRSNILDICKSDEIRTLVKNTPVRVEQNANRLLYLVMKHPNHLTVSLLRLAMLWYYRKSEK